VKNVVCVVAETCRQLKESAAELNIGSSVTPLDPLLDSLESATNGELPSVDSDNEIDVIEIGKLTMAAARLSAQSSSLSFVNFIVFNVYEMLEFFYDWITTDNCMLLICYPNLCCRFFFLVFI
jgi:hypothetical protein